jgi:hypothetical protein
MAILTDAELVLGLSRHLSVFQMGTERAALEHLESAGWVLDIAFRLRGSTTSSPEQIRAIGLEVGLGGRSLKEVLETMDALGWVSIVRDNSGSPVSVSETIPAPGDLVATTPQLLNVLMAGAYERAALAILRATTLQPLLVDDALHAAATESGVDGSSESASTALRHLTFLGLVRHVLSEGGGRLSHRLLSGHDA